MDDDEFGADDDILAALADAQPGPSRPPQQRPVPPRFQQPTPQRLDRAPPSNASSSSGAKVVQPTPQALPSRSSGSSILVSPRQKGNPVLACLKSVPWEYSDILADYGLGLTTCALFLRWVISSHVVYRRFNSLPYVLNSVQHTNVLSPVSSTIACTRNTFTRASAPCSTSTICASS
jgi:hypothetical protein